jgi:hypothetical protein
MLNVCIQRFDVMGQKVKIWNFEGKQGLSTIGFIN